MTEKRKNLLFIAVILALAAVLWLAAHHGGTGRTAVLRYGDPQVEQRIDLRKNAEYDIDTGLYTIHLRVENGGIAFVDSPCPDHLCEGFGTLKNEGDWAACMPAKASVTIDPLRPAGFRAGAGDFRPALHQADAQGRRCTGR